MNTMKRPASTSPANQSDIDELENDIKPTISEAPATPPPAKKAKKARTPKTSPSSGSDDTSPQRTSKKQAAGPPPGEWTAEKRGIVVDRAIAAGYKALDLDALASELELAPRQLVNQLQPGRKSSLRDKAVRAVKGEIGAGEKAT